MVSIGEKIRRAVRCYEENGDMAHRHPVLSRFARELEERIRSSRKAMERLGVVAVCRSCEEEEGGSCCGAGIENRYGVGLLFINLMLGAELPPQRLNPESCHFLGPRGCCLPARHVLCVNYLCGRLREGLGPEKTAALQKVAGEELDCLFRFHETLKKILSPQP